MYGLDLFSGIGGLTKALEGYVRPVAYCENDRYAQGVLLSRMARGDLPHAPIWSDITTLRTEELPKPIHIIYGGFPCQDISVAGRGAGLEGKRSGLFFEISRIVSEIRPPFVFLENVSAITVRGAERVVGELCRLRYDCRWGILSASDVGANHRRDRWWLLAHTRHGSGRDIGALEGGQDASQERGGDNGALGGPSEQPKDVAHSESERRRETGKLRFVEPEKRLTRSGEDVAYAQGDGVEGRKTKSQKQIKRKAVRGPVGSGQDVADSDITRLEGDASQRVQTDAGRGDGVQDGESPWRCGWWSVEPNVGRVASGVPFRVDRLRALGNSVVPAQAREAFERLIRIKKAVT